MFGWVLNTPRQPIRLQTPTKISTDKEPGSKFFSRLSAVPEKMSQKILGNRLISEICPFDACHKIGRPTSKILQKLLQDFSSAFDHFSSRNRCQSDIKLETKYVIYQTFANFTQKRISILTGLTVSSLACKCVHLKDLIDFFQKMVQLTGFGVTFREILRIKLFKKNC